MSDLQSDPKDATFVKYPKNSVHYLYAQYIHDQCDILDKHVPLLSRLTQKDCDLSDSY